jgi:hypothetical protein
MSGPALEARDVELLRRRGITLDEAARQLAVLARGPRHARLDRACSVGDGIERVAAEERVTLEAAHAAAAARGDLAAFTPASGAASRMFKDLLACLSAGGPLRREELEAGRAAGREADRATLEFFDGLDHLALREELALAAGGGQHLDRLRSQGRYRELLEALLGRRGLDYGAIPKGLIPFHSGPDGPRTPFEEHVVDACATMRDARGRCRLHFTVSPGHRPRFEALLEEVRARAGRSLGARPEVDFSEQAPSTDTLALDAAGRPFRDDDGALLLRPAGHGALLPNLAGLDAPVAFVRNIDNVTSQAYKAPTLEWTRLLIGRLCLLRDEVGRRLESLDGADAAREALAFAAARFGSAPPGWQALGGEEAVAAAREALDRPIRVCGMVPNAGEPGGGPFWVRGADGRVQRQIVESAEVDPSDAGQQRILRAATHFNPVFLACALRDAGGRRHDLDRFVNPDAAIVTRKSAGGRELIALERPGLWNGSMAGWNTVFVEVPGEVFHPVKTVLDLLRPEHRAG